MSTAVIIFYFCILFIAFYIGKKICCFNFFFFFFFFFICTSMRNPPHPVKCKCWCHGVHGVTRKKKLYYVCFVVLKQKSITLLITWTVTNDIGAVVFSWLPSLGAIILHAVQYLDIPLGSFLHSPLLHSTGQPELNTKSSISLLHSDAFSVTKIKLCLWQCSKYQLSWDHLDRFLTSWLFLIC